MGFLAALEGRLNEAQSEEDTDGYYVRLKGGQKLGPISGEQHPSPICQANHELTQLVYGHREAVQHPAQQQRYTSDHKRVAHGEWISI